MPASFVDARNDPTSGDNLSTAKSVDKPLSVAAGDLAVFFLTFWNFTGAITAPSGAVQRSSTVNGTERTVVYLRYVETLDTSYTFSWSGSQWSALHAQYFTDVDAALDLATAPFHSATGSGPSFSATTVSTVTGAALAWCGNTQDYSGATTHEPPTGFTETGDVWGSASAYRIASAGGSQSADGATSSPGVNNLAALIAMAPADTGGISQPVGRIIETDTARALTSAKTRALGRITDTSTPRTLTAAKTLTVAGVTDTATARAIGMVKTLEFGRVTEADTARAVTPPPTELGRLVETDTARSLTGSKTKQLGRVTETSTPRALNAAKSRQLARLTEADVARTLTPQGVTIIGRVVQLDQARAWAGSKTRAIGRVTETVEARSLTAVRVITLGRVLDTSTARTFAGSKAKPLGHATEADAARAFVVGVPPPVPEVLTLAAVATRHDVTATGERHTLTAIADELTLTAMEE